MVSLWVLEVHKSQKFSRKNGEGVRRMGQTKAGREGSGVLSRRIWVSDKNAEKALRPGFNSEIAALRASWFPGPTVGSDSAKIGIKHLSTTYSQYIVNLYFISRWYLYSRQNVVHIHTRPQRARSCGMKALLLYPHVPLPSFNCIWR